jgi:hypothetical protein
MPAGAAPAPRGHQGPGRCEDRLVGGARCKAFLCWNSEPRCGVITEWGTLVQKSGRLRGLSAWVAAGPAAERAAAPALGRLAAGPSWPPPALSIF